MNNVCGVPPVVVNRATFRNAGTVPGVVGEPYRDGSGNEYLPMFVARKRTGMFPYFEEVGHVVDAADPLLHDDSLMETLAEAHRVLGVENGLTHAEVRLTERGPLIIVT